MSKILITGSAGYLGSVLVGKLLDAGHHVTGYDNLMYGQMSLLQYASHPNFKFIAGDVRNYELMNQLIKDCDMFLPFASIVGAGACDRDPMSDTIDKAILGYDLKDKMVIYPMSNSGYGCKNNEEFCTENSLLEPISKYGLQKVAVENWLFENHYDNTITLRLATVFGVSSRMRLDLLVNYSVWRCVSDGVICLPEDIQNNLRNFLHIQDAIDCFLYCISNFETMKGQTYNVGNDDLNMTVGDMTNLIAGELGCEVILSHHYKDPDRRNYTVSNERLRQAGFEAKRTIKDEIQNIAKVCKMLQMLNYGRSSFKNA